MLVLGLSGCAGRVAAPALLLQLSLVTKQRTYLEEQTDQHAYVVSAAFSLPIDDRQFESAFAAATGAGMAAYPAAFDPLLEPEAPGTEACDGGAPLCTWALDAEAAAWQAVQPREGLAP